MHAQGVWLIQPQMEAAGPTRYALCFTGSELVIQAKADNFSSVGGGGGWLGGAQYKRTLTLVCSTYGFVKILA